MVIETVLGEHVFPHVFNGLSKLQQLQRPDGICACICVAWATHEHAHSLSQKQRMQITDIKTFVKTASASPLICGRNGCFVTACLIHDRPRLKTASLQMLLFMIIACTSSATTHCVQIVLGADLYVLVTNQPTNLVDKPGSNPLIQALRPTTRKAVHMPDYSVICAHVIMPRSWAIFAGSPNKP